jgi:hypothetical protein
VTTTVTSPVFAERAQGLWENACGVADQFVSEPGTWIFGGSCWLWDARNPNPTGNWLLVLNRWSVSPLAVAYVLPAKVDAVRTQAETLVNAFPGTVQRLAALGCDHAEIVHKPIRTLSDVVDWTWSIWNACVPSPAAAPDPYLYPQHIVSTQVLGRSDFSIVEKSRPGVAVLPGQDSAHVFWRAPGNRTT